MQFLLINVDWCIFFSILALYDFGAPGKVIQDVYDLEAKVQSPINLVNRETQKVEQINLTITQENWTAHIGREE